MERMFACLLAYLLAGVNVIDGANVIDGVNVIDGANVCGLAFLRACLLPCWRECYRWSTYYRWSECYGWSYGSGDKGHITRKSLLLISL